MSSPKKYLFSIVLSICSLGINHAQNELYLSLDSLNDEFVLELLDSSYSLYMENRFGDASEMMASYDPKSIVSDSLRLEYYYDIMILYGHVEIHDKHYENILKGLLLALELENRWMLLSFYRALGSFHVYQFEDYDKGLSYLKEALPYLDAVAANSQTGLMMEIGAACLEANQLDSAKHYFDLAFELLEKDDEVMTADVHSFYIPYLIETEQLDSALFYLGKVNPFWKNYGFKQGYTASCIHYAEVFHIKEEFAKSLEYAKLAKEGALALGIPYLLEEALEFKAKAEEQLGQKDNSLQSFNELNEVQKNIEKIKSQQKLDNKRIEFISSQYVEEIANIKVKNQKLESGVSINRKLITLSGSILIFLSLFYYKSLKKRKESIQDLTAAFEKTKQRNQQLKEDYDRTINQLEKNQRELTSVAMFLEKKNEALLSIRKMLADLPSDMSEQLRTQLASAKKVADNSLRTDENWESFKYFFEKLYPSFANEMRANYSHLNSNELRILAFLKMGLTDKEAARLQNISTSSFQKAKYRLKKKMKLPKELNLVDVVTTA